MKILRFLGVFFLVLISVSCVGQENTTVGSGSKLQVVTTIAPLYSMTLNVAGEYADVHNLVPIGVSEHTYQARPSDVALLSRADVVIKNGVGLEVFLDPLLESSAHVGRRVVDTSSGVILLTSTEEGAQGDPHIWLSIPNAQRQVDTITQALSAADPVHRRDFEQNALSYKTRLKTLDVELQRRMQTVHKKPYVLFHDGFQYFQKEFGLEAAGVVEEFPGKEPSVQYIKELYDVIAEKKVGIAFTEPQFSPKLIEQLQMRFQLHTGVLDTMGTSLSQESYELLMKGNVESMFAAFSK